MTFERFVFPADDGFALELQRAGSAPASGREPILLVHGAGVRANIFNPPLPTTLIDMLLEADFDVWLLDWRGSIVHKPNHWNLDQAAVFDYPAAVRTVIEHTGASNVKAVIHCQGSTSFMMSIVAGLLPQVSTVISNAVALHPIVTGRSWIKSKICGC